MDEAKDSVVTLEVTDHEILTGSADSRVRRYDIRNGRLIVDFIGSKNARNMSKSLYCKFSSFFLMFLTTFRLYFLPCRPSDKR